MPIKKSFSSCYYGFNKENKELLIFRFSSAVAPQTKIFFDKSYKSTNLNTQKTHENLFCTSYNYTVSNLDFDISKSFKSTSIVVNFHKISESSSHLTPIYTESLHCFGTYSELPINELETTIYVGDTTNFPDTGTLIIGGEIINYNKKYFDRFANLIRGCDGSNPKSHNSGEYVRTFC